MGSNGVQKVGLGQDVLHNRIWRGRLVAARESVIERLRPRAITCCAGQVALDSQNPAQKATLSRNVLHNRSRWGRSC